MKFLMVIFALVLVVSCGRKDTNTQKSSEKILPLVKKDTMSSQTRVDSLKVITDSIMYIRNMTEMMKGIHSHGAKADLAAVAHQDPKKTRTLMENIQKNETTRQKIIAEQKAQMAELLKKKKELEKASEPEQ